MTLRTCLILSISCVLVVVAGMLGWLFSSGLARYGDETAVVALRIRSDALSAFVSRSLNEQWQAIEEQAAQLSASTTPEVLQATVESLAASNPRSSWVGIARADGEVVAASGGLLVGENVASRPWFGEGLQGPFAGDVHEAVLLARLLADDSGEPLRFIDFSAPIRSADGTVWGVLGAHLNWRWVQELVAEVADRLALDAFIVNAAGTVILAPSGSEEALQGLQILRSAALGQAGLSLETWPDGRSYYATAVLEPTFESLPPFGWRYVLRLDPAFLFGAADRFRTHMLVAAGLAFVALLLGAALVIGFFTRPLRALLADLLRVAQGQPVAYQRERSRYAELTMVSDVIARLQSRPLADRSRDHAAK